MGGSPIPRPGGAGAQGLKIWKPLGLHVRDQHGKLVAVDDVRLLPLWETAGELNVPVLVHVADPVAFFDPLTPQNERWEELQAHPDWQFPSPPLPSISNYYGAVRPCREDDTKTPRLSGRTWVVMLKTLAGSAICSMNAPTSILISQPELANLVGSPTRRGAFSSNMQSVFCLALINPPTSRCTNSITAFLETDDEYFNYSLSPTPDQGRWRVYGLHLPDEVLKKDLSRKRAPLIKFWVNPLGGL
ncbi:MAG: hypothetical protein M5U34_01490 [Chloroflexi bacterium]|nr:hypothetical protein [Chloroflexota bacterium]